MDAQLESLVELYLTRGGKVFVSPQYDVPYDKDALDGGACPDILALDFEHKDVLVVEVSSAAGLTSLFGRVAERESRWFAPIRRRLQADKIIDTAWSLRFLGFVRESNVDHANRKFTAQADVLFVALESAAFSFAYWDKRATGLPR
ncbi:hypothetical protein SAMN05216548_12713 [Faunimonas pinastri]|uniref:Uncharacterized protein n=1 Tax=Faunimonas pinastri TaxID=1855383 RepID=A0A1H9QD85_9HYPH|nr:hypothetical protein [Faunimonas pinastri]SER58378.1 hypothetical protein SAMN05216548_12713 [Faunimonas pinastri]